MAYFFDDPIAKARVGFDEMDVLMFWIWKSQIDAGIITGEYRTMDISTPWIDFQIVRKTPYGIKDE